MLSFLLSHLIHQRFAGRSDGNPKLSYYDVSDLGCKSKPFSFKSENNLLRGEKVFVGAINDCKKAMVFFHGIGAGHTAYSSEIAYFAKKGFLVYAYDNTGCMLSEGKGMNHMAHTFVDVKAFFEYLKSDEDYHGQEIVACGHSWGGWSALQCLNEEIPVGRIVSMGSFCKLEDVFVSQGSLPKWFAQPIRRGLKREFGIDAVNRYDMLKQTKKPVLFVYGEKDHLLTECGAVRLINELSLQNPNISCKEIKNRGHNCYWTEKTDSYFHDLLYKYNYLDINAQSPATFDINKIQDDRVVMDLIFDFLNS